MITDVTNVSFRTWILHSILTNILFLEWPYLSLYLRGFLDRIMMPIYNNKIQSIFVHICLPWLWKAPVFNSIAGGAGYMVYPKLPKRSTFCHKMDQKLGFQVVRGLHLGPKGSALKDPSKDDYGPGNNSFHSKHSFLLEWNVSYV